MKDKNLLENQLKELEQKLNDETSKVKKSESSYCIRCKKVPRYFKTGLDEIFMEGFGLIGPYDQLSETDSENEKLVECAMCGTDYEPTGIHVPCTFQSAAPECPLCVEFRMASWVSFRHDFAITNF